MKDLSWDDQVEILHGCAILGTGGGGQLSQGLNLMRRAHERGARIRLVDLAELPGDAPVACPYCCGTVSADIDHALLAQCEYPALKALRALSEHLGKPIGGIITTELGGHNSAVAMYAAALTDVPLVDADPAGRSVPELQQSTFFLSGLSMCPMAIADVQGDCIIVKEVVDDYRAEALVRSFAVVSDNLVWVADHSAPAEEMSGAVIRGAISQAQRIGQRYLESRKAGRDVAEAVALAGGGGVRFRGTVSHMTWCNTGGFTVGDALVEGSGEWTGSQYSLMFKNEFLSGKIGDIYDVTVPDLICVFDMHTQECVANPGLEPGMTVAVVALPSPDVWRTDSGLAVLGPQHFGLATVYRPFS